MTDTVYRSNLSRSMKRLLVKSFSPLNRIDLPDSVGLDDRIANAYGSENSRGGISRRKFLKIGAVVAGALAVAGLGADYQLGGPVSQYFGYKQPHSGCNDASIVTCGNNTIITVNNSTSTATSTTSEPLSSLSLRLFFDYNGNGIQDNDEPSIADAKVLLKDRNGNVVSEGTTDSAGDVKLEDIRGIYALRLYVEADKKFRYTSLSNREFSTVSGGYPTVLLGGQGKVNIGLMEGFLTLPMTKSSNFKISKYYDLDPTIKNYLWWNGKRGVIGFNHDGIDYDTNEGEPIIAAMPSWVYKVEKGSISMSYGAFIINYGHGRKSFVSAGDFVPRGHLIGEVGSISSITKKPTGYNHLHLGLYSDSIPTPNLAGIDPFSPTFILESKNSGVWYSDLSKTITSSATDLLTWFPLPLNQNPNLVGYWTQKNEPHFSI